MKSHLLTAGLLVTTLIAGAVVVNAQQDQPRERGERWSARAEGQKPAGPRGPQAPRGPQGPGQFGHGPQHGGPEHGPLGVFLRPFWENEQAVELAGLSESQIAQLDESLELLKSGEEARRDAIKSATQALHEEIKKDSPDLATVNSLHDAVAAATAAEKKAILGHAVTVKNILTAEQEEALKEAGKERMKERFPRLAERMQERRQRGPAPDAE